MTKNTFYLMDGGDEAVVFFPNRMSIVSLSCFGITIFECFVFVCVCVLNSMTELNRMLQLILWQCE